MLLIDLFWQGKHKGQAMSMKQAAAWSIVGNAFASLAAGFGGILMRT